MAPLHTSLGHVAPPHPIPPLVSFCLCHVLLSGGTCQVPLSKLDKELKGLPLLERKLFFLDDRSSKTANTKQ